MPILRSVISLDDFSPLFVRNKHNAEHINTFKSLLTKPFTKEKLPKQTIPNADLFAIIYTSGTTGFSKGVMLTHNNITGNMVYSRTNMPLVPGDHILSFLPLAHGTGCAIEFLYPFTSGCSITFLGKMPTPQLLLVKAFAEIHPKSYPGYRLLLRRFSRSRSSRYWIRQR